MEQNTDFHGIDRHGTSGKGEIKPLLLHLSIPVTHGLQGHHLVVALDHFRTCLPHTPQSACCAGCEVDSSAECAMRLPYLEKSLLHLHSTLVHIGDEKCDTLPGGDQRSARYFARYDKVKIYTHALSHRNSFHIQHPWIGVSASLVQATQHLEGDIVLGRSFGARVTVAKPHLLLTKFRVLRDQSGVISVCGYLINYDGPPSPSIYNQPLLPRQGPSSDNERLDDTPEASKIPQLNKTCLRLSPYDAIPRGSTLHNAHAVRLRISAYTRERENRSTHSARTTIPARV